MSDDLQSRPSRKPRAPYTDPDVVAARTSLKSYLTKYNWSDVPKRHDPDGAAFYNDPEAVRALTVYRTVSARVYRQTHSQLINANTKRYWATHHAKVLELSNARRARLVHAEGSFTRQEFELLCIEYDNCCVYCGGSTAQVGALAADHILPLSRGGSNNLSNIVPACVICNSRKGAKTFEEFMKYLEEEVSYGRL